jgi:hypothetical protein
VDSPIVLIGIELLMLYAVGGWLALATGLLIVVPVAVIAWRRPFTSFWAITPFAAVAFLIAWLAS